MLFTQSLANKGDLLTEHSNFRIPLLKQDDAFSFLSPSPNALSPCPLLASIFFIKEIISFSKPITGILKKLLNLVSLSKRLFKGSTSPTKELLDITLEKSHYTKLATMSLTKGPSLRFYGNSNREPSFDNILSG